MFKKKILYVHHGSGIGGALVSLLKLVEHVNKEKYDVKIVFINYQPDAVRKQLNSKGISFVEIGKYNSYWSHQTTGYIRFWQFWKYFKIFYHWLMISKFIAPKIYEEETPDIIHLNSVVLSAWSYAAKKRNIPVVCHNRGPLTKGYFGIRIFLLRRLLDNTVNRFISISNDNAKRLNIPEKTSVIYNFIEIPDTYIEPFEIDKKLHKVLYLGGVSLIKGYKTVVDSLKYLDQDILIQFAGNIVNINYEKGVKGFIKKIIKKTVYKSFYEPFEKLNKASNVEILGRVNDPLKYIDECDILITPFKTEHFSRPAIEAFAYGKPVIGSNVEGMDEIIDDGINGLLIEKNNPKALAEAINELCRHPEKAKEMGENGRKKAIKYFSPENVKKVEQIYEQLLRDYSER